MAKSKRQFYRKGTDVQKNADMTVEIRYPSIHRMTNWTEEERKHGMKFLEDCRKMMKKNIAIIESILQP